MCRYKQDSEYALNMAKFWIWQGSQYASVTQRYEYVRICLDSSEYILGSKYARSFNMAKF